MLTTIGEPLFVPPQILCDPSKLWSFSSLPPLTTTTQPLQHTLFFPCSRHHHHLQAFFFFLFFLYPCTRSIVFDLHLLRISYSPIGFSSVLTVKKKPSSCLPRSSRTSLRRRRPRRRIRLVFSIIPCLFSVVFKGRRLTFIPLIDLWYEKRTYRKPPST